MQNEDFSLNVHLGEYTHATTRAPSHAVYTLVGTVVVSASWSAPYYKHVGLDAYLFQAPHNGGWMLTDHKDKIKESRGFLFTAQKQLSDPTGELTTLFCFSPNSQYFHFV